MEAVKLPQKAEYLAEKLKGELVSDKFKVNSRFLSIPKVAEKFNVSPVTAHKAVRSLVKQGYLRSVARKGYFVASKPNKEDILFDDIYTKKLLFIVKPESMDKGSSKVISGLQPICIEEGCRIEILPSNAPDIVSEANSVDVAGVILEIIEEFPYVNEIKKPKICIGRWPKSSEEVASFIGDIEEALNMTVDYFYKFGHRTISILIGKSGEPADEVMLGQIMAGYIRGMKSKGLDFSKSVLYVNPEEDHHSLVRRFVDNFRGQGITSVFVLHWSTLIVLLQEMHRRGLDIPSDLSIIVYGESEFTEHVKPKMTRFELHIQEISKEAARVIFSMEGEKGIYPKTTLFPVELIEGESVRKIGEEEIERELWGTDLSPQRKEIMKLMREKFGKEQADKLRRKIRNEDRGL